MYTKHRKVKRKFLLSKEELKSIDNMMQSNDVESRLLGLSLLETSAFGKHYFVKGKIKTGKRLFNIINKLRRLLYYNNITITQCKYHSVPWLNKFVKWINSETY